MEIEKRKCTSRFRRERVRLREKIRSRGEVHLWSVTSTDRNDATCLNCVEARWQIPSVAWLYCHVGVQAHRVYFILTVDRLRKSPQIEIWNLRETRLDENMKMKFSEFIVEYCFVFFYRWFLDWREMRKKSCIHICVHICIVYNKTLAGTNFWCIFFSVIILISIFTHAIIYIFIYFDIYLQVLTFICWNTVTHPSLFLNVELVATTESRLLYEIINTCCGIDASRVKQIFSAASIVRASIEWKREESAVMRERAFYLLPLYSQPLSESHCR